MCKAYVEMAFHKIGKFKNFSLKKKKIIIKQICQKELIKWATLDGRRIFNSENFYRTFEFLTKLCDVRPPERKGINEKMVKNALMTVATIFH